MKQLMRVSSLRAVALLMSVCFAGAGCTRTRHLWDLSQDRIEYRVPEAEVLSLDGVYAADAGGLGAIVTLTHPRFRAVRTTSVYWFEEAELGPTDAVQCHHAPDSVDSDRPSRLRVVLPLRGEGRGLRLPADAGVEPVELSARAVLEAHAGPGRWVFIEHPLVAAPRHEGGDGNAFVDARPAFFDVETVRFVVLPGPYPNASAEPVRPGPIGPAETTKRVLMTPLTVAVDLLEAFARWIKESNIDIRHLEEGFG